jgi:sarcosine oxidase
VKNLRDSGYFFKIIDFSQLLENGESRIVRQAIGEGEHYVPLALRSYEIWSEIEQKIGHQLLHRVGGLVLSSTSDGSSAQRNDFFSTTVTVCSEISYSP